MIKKLILLTACSTTIALANAKMPIGKELLQTEEPLKIHKLSGGELLTFHTEKNFDELSQALKLKLGESWQEVKTLKVPLPEAAQKNGVNLDKKITFEHSDNPKFRVSMTLTESPGAASKGKSLLLLTLMKNYQPPSKKNG